MMEFIILALILVCTPMIFLLYLCTWIFLGKEIDRPPTKEEWKEGKRERQWY